jgi:hypothetical protein
MEKIYLPPESGHPLKVDNLSSLKWYNERRRKG